MSRMPDLYLGCSFYFTLHQSFSPLKWEEVWQSSQAPGAYGTGLSHPGRQGSLYLSKAGSRKLTEVSL